jgi:hypothetical protein
MNEKILQKLLDYLQNSEDFALEQIPEIVQEALKYEKVSAYLSIGLMLLLLSIAAYIGYHSWKHPTLDKYGSREIGSFLGVAIPFCTAPMLFIQFCCSVDKLIKMHLAPKYFLIELVTSMKK